jgi:hypothetical protein
MRELVLESEDTVVSKPVFETLEDMIEHNKRWNYMVEPAHTLSAVVRLDDGNEVPALELSQHHLKISAPTDLKPAAFWSGVLVIPTGEMPVSGTIESSVDGQALIQLDMLISTYHHVLEEYLTRLHMLDFVV